MKQAGRIFYLTVGRPTSGGQQVNEEHVVALRSLGLDAQLLQWPRNAGSPSPASDRDDPSVWPVWDTAAPLTRFTSPDVLRPGDTVVIPEPWRMQLRAFASWPVRRVVHCQNPYYMFHGTASLPALAEAGYAHILSCSRYTSQLIRQCGWTGGLHTVAPQIDPVFTPTDSAGGPQRQLQVAFMPRKRAIEAIFLQGLFRSLYPQWAQVPWVALDGISRAECAARMRNSAVFASLSHLEGLGLPPLEAMASGCLVAGFTGGGGGDYATPSNGFWAAEGDHEGFCQAVNEALRCASTPAWADEVRAASATAVAAHTPEAFQRDLLAAWTTILS